MILRGVYAEGRYSADNCSTAITVSIAAKPKWRLIGADILDLH